MTEVMDLLTVRHVKIDRNRSPHTMLEGTGRNLYGDHAVISAMPRGEGDHAEVFFFLITRWLSDEELQKEYESLKLKPADPYVLGAVNDADPAFAGKHSNATHWKDAEGRWCYAAFAHYNDKPGVYVDRADRYWPPNWWGAGERI